jgi:hypothetical protein
VITLTLVEPRQIRVVEYAQAEVVGYGAPELLTAAHELDGAASPEVHAGTETETDDG